MALFALLVCAGAIGCLFYLDHDKKVHTSKALWLPVMWLGIVGSRPVSNWFGANEMSTAPGAMLDATLEGSPLDAFVYTALLAAGVCVLLTRRPETGRYLRANHVVVVYLSYCLMSVLWSVFPEAALKRWTKDLGDLVMVLVILTDPHPTVAIRLLLSRVGFILLPASLFLIRYSQLGRGYDPAGQPMNTGVTTNKNTLGVMAFVLGVGALWNVAALLRAKGAAGRGRRLIGQGAFLGFAVAVLAMARSATSLACFTLGSALIVVASLRGIRRHPNAVHAVVLAGALAIGLIMLVGLQGSVVQALGRDTNLTGRTEIWSVVIPMAKNPVIGAGFESFWNEASKTLRNSSEVYMFGGLNSAHNGYIEVYLNLGWVGVCLIALILVTSYRRAVSTFRRDPELGALGLAYIATAAIYSITEAGFRVLSPMWICLLLASVAVGRGATQVIDTDAPVGQSQWTESEGHRKRWKTGLALARSRDWGVSPQAVSRAGKSGEYRGATRRRRMFRGTSDSTVRHGGR